ncbi:MAG: Maf family protein [Bdellovibrionales bacterium]|nr:Maf family protein [Bdellovibrionales bacterium]
MKIILASSSEFRKQQLQQLGIHFNSIKPAIDEESLKNYDLPPCEFTLKLGYEKAQSLTTNHPDSIIIGSDQVAYFNEQYLEKSKTHKEACDKLLKLQNNTHKLYTSLVVITPKQTYEHVDVTELKMRPLSEQQISNYVQKDQSLNCAGGYKFEKSGQFLFEYINTKDPSSIIGLPMLKLTTILIENGVKIL